MTNPLVEHLREGAQSAGGGFAARILRLASPAYWRGVSLRIRQRPVARVCLGLVTAFVCGIALGVGVAAMITPEVAEAVPAVAARTTAPVPASEPVIAVRLRDESKPARRDTDDGAAPVASPDTSPVTSIAPEYTAAKPTEKIGPLERVEPAGDAGAVAESSAESSPSQGDSMREAHVQVPIAGVVRGTSERTDDAKMNSGAIASTTPSTAPEEAAVPDMAFASGPPPTAESSASETPSPASMPGDANKAPQNTAGNGISFEGAKSVAEAATHSGGVQERLPLLSPRFADMERHRSGAGGDESPADNAAKPLKDLELPPHPVAKDLQLAALPMPRADAWIRNAVKMPEKPRDVMIAIIIDDMGIDQKRSRAAIKLPAPLTLSFIPYGYHLHELVDLSRKAGHEVMLHMPMEPLDPEADPGPNALRTTVSIKENRRRLLWAFSRLDGIVGLNNHMGSRFTTWKEGMEMVLQEVHERGLLFVDSFTNNESVGYLLAHQHKLPSSARDVFIDHDITQTAIDKSLVDIEKIARRRGYAVGIAHPHDLTREALRSWIEDATARGVDFVPISHIIRRNMKSG